jgi:hypothetical protein
MTVQESRIHVSSSVFNGPALQLQFIGSDARVIWPNERDDWASLYDCDEWVTTPLDADLYWDFWNIKTDVMVQYGPFDEVLVRNIGTTSPYYVIDGVREGDRIEVRVAHFDRQKLLWVNEMPGQYAGTTWTDTGAKGARINYGTYEPV